MLDLLKEYLRPASISCVLMLLAPGVLLLFVPPLARWGRRWLAAVFLGYAVLSNPFAAALLARTVIGGYQPLTSADQARRANVIVVLGSGSVNLRGAGRQLSFVTMPAGLRVLEAARLSDMLHQPWVIASGGVTEPDSAAAPEAVALRRALIDVGIQPDRILLEDESKNTRDEAVVVKRMLAERGWTNFILVTSPQHMRRAVLAFEEQGMHPIPSPSPLVPERLEHTNPLMPSDMWLVVADSIVYEWLARGYYWWRGWLHT